MDFTIGQSDNLPTITSNLEVPEGTYLDLSAASGVNFIYQFKSRAGQPNTGQCLRLGDTSGHIQFQFPNTVSGGYYYGQFRINFSGGGQVTIPNSEYLLFQIYPKL